MAVKSNKKMDDGVDSDLSKVVKGFESSWRYTEASWQPMWMDMYRLYNNERVEVSYNGLTDTFIPMSYSIIETMVSAMSGEKPQVEYISTSPEQATNTEVLNGMFSFYWDLDSWTNTLIQYTRSLFLYGTAVLHVYWDIDHPCVRIVPLRDFFCDPSATILNYQEAGYMGYRFLASKSELEKEEIIDPETGEMKKKYSNLDKLGGNFNSGEMTDKQEKDMHMGSTFDKAAQSDQIEVICYYTKDDVIYVGNRQEVIYKSKNFYKERQEFLGYQNPTGMYPFVVDAYSPDESLLYGMSALKPIAKPQELLNDLTNQNVDAVSWAIDPVMELAPEYSSYIDKVKNVTGAVYPFKPGSLSAVNKPQIPPNAFNERVNIKNEIREATAIDQVIKGASSAADTTATEIKAQVASAGRRFDLVLSQLENGGYYRLAKLVYQLISLYVTAPTYYRVIGEKGVDWKLFDPEMFQGQYEPRIKLRATLEQEKAKKMRDLKEFYTAMLGSPYVNQGNLTRLVTKEAFNMEPDEVDGLVLSDEEVAKMAENQGSKSDTDPKELLNYKDAPPDIQAQMEAAAGYEPSQMHIDTMETTAAEQAAKQAAAVGTVAPEGMAPPGMGVAPQMPQMQGPVNG